MARPLIEGLHYTAVAPRALTEGPLAGVPAHVLSADDTDPAAFSGVATVTGPLTCAPGGDRSIDLVVLAGDMKVGGRAATAGHYAFVPRGDRSVTIEAAPGTRFFFAFGGLGAGDGDVIVVDPETIPWTVRTRQNVPHSSSGTSTNIVKFVRTDPVTDDRSGFGAMFPTNGLDCAEWHEAGDEGFVLRGDGVVFGPDADLVQLQAGSYYWRPPNVRHLPKYSFAGSLSFFRTHGTGWDSEVHYAPEPRWPVLLADYVARRQGEEDW